MQQVWRHIEAAAQATSRSQAPAAAALTSILAGTAVPVQPWYALLKPPMHSQPLKPSSKSMLGALSARFHPRQHRNIASVSVLPPELWSQILWPLDEASLTSVAGVSKLLNRLSCEVHFTQRGETIQSLCGGSRSLTLDATVGVLATLRRSIAIFPELETLLCSIDVDDTVFDVLKSLHRTVVLAPRLKKLHLGFTHRLVRVHDSDVPWLDHHAEHLLEYANLAHDVFFAMASKQKGRVVYIDPRARDFNTEFPILISSRESSNQARIEVTTPRKLCYTLLSPSLEPVPKTRFSSWQGRKAPGPSTTHVQRTALAERVAIEMDGTNDVAASTSIPFKKHRRRRGIAEDSVSWCHIAELQTIEITLHKTKKFSSPFALVVLDAHRIRDLRLHIYRWSTDIDVIWEIWRRKTFISLALPVLDLPCLRTIHLPKSMVGRLQGGISQSSLDEVFRRHARTLVGVQCDEGGQLDGKSLPLGREGSLPADASRVRCLRATDASHMLRILSAFPPSEPCIIGLNFNHLIRQRPSESLLAFSKKHIAQTRILLRSLAERTGDTTLSLKRTWTPGLADEVRVVLDPEDAELIRRLKSVSKVVLDTPDCAVFPWIEHLPGLKSLSIQGYRGHGRLDKYYGPQEERFREEAERRRVSRGWDVSLSY
uniref:F-box domain-containing protein n=1 Tax=Mycena chlorophos TaxID=658473 RepID=A0ABQ0M2H7_MYCCL|nr:predicted protein [Mycena chlorophos]